MNFLNKLELFILFLFCFTFPIFILPWTFEATETGKLLLLVSVTLILLAVSAVKIAVNKRITFNKSTFLVPLILLALMFVAGTIINSPNKILALISAQSTSTFVTLLFFYLILTGQNRNLRLLFMDFTVYGTVINSLYIIAMYLGLLKSNVIVPSGNLLSTGIFLLTIIVYQVPTLFTSSFRKNIAGIISLVVIAAAEIFLIFHLISDQKPIVLPHAHALAILKEIAAHPRSLLLGVGPSNFISAFTIAKPVSINESEIWNITFTSSSSLFTNLVSETGIISGLAYLLVLILTVGSLVKIIKGNQTHSFPVLISLMVLILLLLFFPASSALLILLYLLMSLAADIKVVRIISLKKIGLAVYSIPLLCLLISGFIAFKVINWYLAESLYFKSFQVLEKGDGTAAYNLQKRSADINPRLDRYHLALSQTSLYLAESLANKKNPMPEDNEKIPKLIEQAIQEGRTAINLNKTNIVNWTNLTRIYSSLIDFAPGAEKWAVDIAKQTIELDPNNPNHHISLAKIYIKIGQENEAKESVNKAKALKPEIKSPL